MTMSRAAGLAQLDLLARQIDQALDAYDRRRFHLLAMKRRTLLRWLAK